MCRSSKVPTPVEGPPTENSGIQAQVLNDIPQHLASQQQQQQTNQTQQVAQGNAAPNQTTNVQVPPSAAPTPPPPPGQSSGGTMQAVQNFMSGGPSEGPLTHSGQAAGL